uniref:Uncharacterized protein n=1 Tax=Arion vulgaris TaxID=1028688 RepID=A0A0B7AG39_9EUPU
MMGYSTGTNNFVAQMQCHLPAVDALVGDVMRIVAEEVRNDSVLCMTLLKELNETPLVDNYSNSLHSQIPNTPSQQTKPFQNKLLLAFRWNQFPKVDSLNIHHELV